MQGYSYYTITREDVGRGSLSIFGRERAVPDITLDDIGKHVTLDWETDMLTIENDAERAARVKGYGGRA